MNNITQVVTHQRVCGFRQAGGTYLRTEIGKHGIPIEKYMVCPPYPIDISKIGVADWGVFFRERDGTGVWDAWDVVGGEYTLPSFVAEAKEYGTSRKVSRTAAEMEGFKKLDPRVSRHFFIFRGILAPHNYEAIIRDRHNIAKCPAGHEVHDHPEDPIVWDFCLAHLWECEGKVIKPRQLMTFNTIPGNVDGVSYEAMTPPEDFDKSLASDYGIFLSLPITHIDVIVDQSEEQIHKAALELLEDSNFSVRLCNE